MIKYIDWDKKRLSSEAGYLYAVFTDEFWFRKLPLAEDAIKNMDDKSALLLEIRCFDPSSEYRLFRSDISKECFIDRLIKDSKETKDCFDEYQYFDIDIPASKRYKKTDNANCVVATGGGAYEFPVDCWENAKLQIRNYIAYDESGMAYVKDWRMVNILEQKKQEKEQENEQEGGV